MQHTDTSRKHSAALLTPTIDFFMVGGASLLFLLAIALFLEPQGDTMLILGIVGLILANIINHPHFAHSYQILYSNFHKKLLSDEYEPHMRRRYWLAGVIVPLVIIAFYVLCFFWQSPHMLGYAANAMFFLVGWHYVKQGYGILIVLSVKKRAFLNDSEKNALRYNGYVLWIISWLLANDLVSEKQYFGLDYYTFNVPDMSMHFGYLCASVSTTLCAWLLCQRYKRGDTMPAFNGVVAYVSSVYIWIFVRWIDPTAALLIPAFHSLQYLPFVWSYKYNQYRQQYTQTLSNSFWHSKSLDIAYKMTLFILGGMLLGFIGFFTLPNLLDVVINYDHDLFGITMFVFMWWIFINVHHYFIDNSIWRKENKDVQRYLFAS